jgi:hypothetical protein
VQRRDRAAPGRSGRRRRSGLVLGLVAALVVAGVVAWAVYDSIANSSGRPYAFFTQVPPGYSLDRQDSGGLTLSTASRATVADSADVKAALRQDGFQGGQVRSWLDGQQFIELAVFTLGSPGQARRFERFEVNYALKLPGNGASEADVTFAVPHVPATAFYANGNQSGDGQPLFAQGSWFTRGDRAYLVYVGAPYPTTTILLDTLTSGEYRSVASRSS